MSKKILILLCSIMIVLGFALPAGLFAGSDKAVKSISDYEFEGLKKKTSIDLRNMEIIDVLKFLAVEGDLNIVSDKGISGPVNLFINDITIGELLEVVLSINNLAYEIEGNIIKVMSNEKHKRLYGVNFYDPRETLVYKLKYASAENIGTMLGNIKSDIGKIIFDDSTGTLVLIDTPEKIKEMKKIIRNQELPTVTRVLPTETEVFELKYAKVDDIKDEISALLTANIGSMRTDSRTNTMVITDLPHQLKKTKVTIAAFDRKIREVFIEAKIIQVTLNDTFKWGIDWNQLIKYQKRKKDGDKRKIGITPEINMPLNLETFGKLSISNLITSDIKMVLELLSTVGETKILSNPHIATQEGKEATIEVVTRQPYSQTTTTITEASETQATEYIFVDVGIMLNVTLTINQDGFISMFIKPEVSSITDWYPSSSSETRVPVVETANAEATVLVKDGTTIIIAGMIKDSKTRSKNKIPLLGSLPIIGRLFSNVSDVIQRTETIIFLTPRIISGDESYLLERDMKKRIKENRE